MSTEPTPESRTRPATAVATKRKALLVWAAVLFPLGAACGVLLGVLFVPAPPTDTGPVYQPPPAPADAAPPAAGPIRSLVFASSPVRPEETPDVLAAGTAQVFCFFSASDLEPADDIGAMWLIEAGRREDAVVSVMLDEEAAHISGHVVLKPPGEATAFAAGIYELALTADGLDVVEGSFTAVEDAASLLAMPEGMDRYQPEVKNLTVTSTPPPEKPGAEHLILPETPERVSVSFSYSHAVPGTVLFVGWLYEDGIIAQATTELNIQAESGKAEAWLGAQGEAFLPIGMYGVFVATDPDAQPVARKRFWIGRIPRPSEIAPVQ